MNRTWMGTVTLVVLLAGCGLDPDAGTGLDQVPAAATEQEEQQEGGASRGCSAAFGNAAAKVERGQVLAQDDLRPAMTACRSVEDFTAGAEEHPVVLDGVDPVTYATNQCAAVAHYRDAPVCEEINGS